MLTIHVCLVSDRLEANLIPLLQLRPDVVVLVTSERMQGKAEILQKLLRSEVPTMEVLIKGGLPDLDVNGIEGFALKLSVELEEQYPDARCVYNTTGGSKLMAIIFSQVFEHSIYTHSEHNQIITLNGPSPPTAPRAIEPVLTAKNYLLANGKRLRSARSSDKTWPSVARERAPLTQWLARKMDRNVGDLLGQLNRFIHNDKPSVLRDSGRRIGYEFDEYQACKRLDRAPNRARREALAKMAQTGVLSWSEEEAESLTFLSLDSCLYLAGGWLEEYAWLSAADAGCQEVLCGAEITDEYAPKRDIRNEVDCLLVHNNRMLVIECKTRKLGGDDQSDSDMLTKLDSLTQRSSGLFGKGLLLTAREFGRDKNHETNVARANSLGIDVLEQAQLRQLPAMIGGWMKTGTLGVES